MIPKSGHPFSEIKLNQDQPGSDSIRTEKALVMVVPTANETRSSPEMAALYTHPNACGRRYCGVDLT